MIKIRNCDEKDFPALVAIWERSVRATHSFLTEKDIEEIKEELIPYYFTSVDLFVLTDKRIQVGFLGLSGRKIEMLFVDASCRGKGYGTRLMDYAIQSGATFVDVNEQNHEAIGFYQKQGFHIISRSSVDDSGRPFPILHLSR